MKIDKNPLKNLEKNPFGGKNPHGMYVPLTDTELEVLERLALGQDFKLVIKDWGYVEHFRLGQWNPETWDGSPIVQFGDKRIAFYFTMNLSAPAIPQPNYYFDFEVWAKGHMLFATRQETTNGGKPIQVCAGMQLGLALDVALDRIDPKIIREIKPGAVGLTTRHGNMKLNVHEQRMLRDLQNAERKIREASAEDVRKVLVQARKDGVK